MWDYLVPRNALYITHLRGRLNDGGADSVVFQYAYMQYIFIAFLSKQIFTEPVPTYMETVCILYVRHKYVVL